MTNIVISGVFDPWYRAWTLGVDEPLRHHPPSEPHLPNKLRSFSSGRTGYITLGLELFDFNFLSLNSGMFNRILYYLLPFPLPYFLHSSVTFSFIFVFV